MLPAMLLLLHIPLYVGSPVALLRGGNDIVMMLGIRSSGSRWYGNESPLSSSSGLRLGSVVFGGSCRLFFRIMFCALPRVIRFLSASANANDIHRNEETKP